MLCPRYCCGFEDAQGLQSRKKRLPNSVETQQIADFFPYVLWLEEDLASHASFWIHLGRHPEDGFVLAFCKRFV